MSPRLKLYHDGDGIEYLEVTCEECGYSWNMETADDKPKEIMEGKEEEVIPESLKLLRDTQAETEKKAAEDEDTKEAPVEKV